MNALLDWREIFDCKLAGQHVDETCKMAYESNYGYFCHNGRIYRIRDMENCELVDCITAMDPETSA